MVSFKQIEALIWVARLGTFERAADRLNVTQSTISKRVYELEQIVGVDLFDRNGHVNKLTVNGEKLLALGENMLLLQAQAMDLNASTDMPAKKLRIGVTELTAMTWLPKLIFALREHFPKVKFEPNVAMTNDLHRGLLAGDYDIVITPEISKISGTIAIRLADVENVWAASPTLFPSTDILTYADLAKFTLITQGSRSGAGILVSAWLRARGIELPNQIQCDNLIALLGLTVAGLGVSYIPIHCQRALIRSRKLKVIELDVPLPLLPYSAYFCDDRPAAFILEVIELAKKIQNYHKLFA